MRGFIAATLFTAAMASPAYSPSYGGGYSTGEESSAPAVSYPAETPSPVVCCSAYILVRLLLTS